MHHYFKDLYTQSFLVISVGILYNRVTTFSPFFIVQHCLHQTKLKEGICAVIESWLSSAQLTECRPFCKAIHGGYSISLTPFTQWIPSLPCSSASRTYVVKTECIPLERENRFCILPSSKITGMAWQHPHPSLFIYWCLIQQFTLHLPGSLSGSWVTSSVSCEIQIQSLNVHRPHKIYIAKWKFSQWK